MFTDNNSNTILITIIPYFLDGRIRIRSTPSGLANLHSNPCLIYFWTRRNRIRQNTRIRNSAKYLKISIQSKVWAAWILIKLFMWTSSRVVDTDPCIKKGRIRIRIRSEHPDSKSLQNWNIKLLMWAASRVADTDPCIKKARIRIRIRS